LDFTLGVLDHARDQAIAAGRKALIQFVNVSCSWEEPWLGFRTKDGSFIKADIDAGRAWGWLSSEVISARHLFTDLLLAPLMEMLKRRGYYGLHAAAVTKDGAGYLLPGGAGSGKTTLALGLIKQGFAYLADDKLLLRREDDAILALAFTRHFNIDPQISHYYPELHFLNDLDPLPFTLKRPVDVSSIYPDTFASRTQPRYLIHIERTGDSRSEIRPLGPAESFNRLVHQTIFAARKETALRQLELLCTHADAVRGLLDRVTDRLACPYERRRRCDGPGRRRHGPIVRRAPVEAFRVPPDLSGASWANSRSAHSGQNVWSSPTLSE
jgi:hypothetical protein